MTWIPVHDLELRFEHMKTRHTATLLTVVLVMALAGAISPASATHLGYKTCRDMTFRRATAKHVKSNFGCRSARRALRSLLAHGVGGLPKPTTDVGRWGCTKTGYKHFVVCERRRSDSQAPPGVVFAAHARKR
jgi:hypothetical protein